MLSTGINTQFTGCQSPPGPPSRRLPSVASGERRYDDYSIFYSKTWAGSSLTKPHFDPNNGVHLTCHAPQISSDVLVLGNTS